MASIGSITDLTMQGVIHPPRRRVSQFVRDGIAGSGYTRTKAHGTVSQVITHHTLEAEEIDPGGGDPPVVVTPKEKYITLRDAAYAIIGTVVTVVDAFGESFNNVVVQDCQVSEAVATLGTGGLYCAISWSLIAESNSEPPPE